jgi:hypothetical protein
MGNVRRHGAGIRGVRRRNDQFDHGALLTSYGWQAVMDGGLRQLLEIVITGYLSMAAYVIFKVCEHVLVDHIVEDTSLRAGDEET